MGIVTAVPESVYRRLNIVQNQIISGEEHTAALNPKGYRAACLGSGRAGSTEILRGVLDGAFLQRRWAALSEGRKAEIGAKAGISSKGISDDLVGLETAMLYL